MVQRIFGTDRTDISYVHFKPPIFIRKGLRDLMKFGPPLPVGDAGSGNATFQHLCIDDLYSGSAGDP